MIEALVALNERIKTTESSVRISHDALNEEHVSVDCVIDREGRFIDFIYFSRKPTVAEAIAAKKGKARLLLDKAEEVLNYGTCNAKKHQLFLDKLNEYRDVPALQPVINFYHERKEEGFNKAHLAYDPEQNKTGNIGFLIQGEDKRVHEKNPVYSAIIQKYDTEQTNKLKGKICSICGEDKYPVEDLPHGMIKCVPSGQPSGCALVSYNKKAFESYFLLGNDNASICSHCAKAYVESLNWLLCNKMTTINEKGKEKAQHTNRKNIGSDTVIVYWTRDHAQCDELNILDKPKPETVTRLLESAYTGQQKYLGVDTNLFYALTLSGASARIAVRDWIEISIEQMQKNIVYWFKDIKILRKGETSFPAIYQLAASCDNARIQDRQLTSRVGAVLWKAALKNNPIPIWVLSAVLGRIRSEHQKKEGKRIESVDYIRAALIKMILNRSHQNGGKEYMSTIDQTNYETAYLCGRAFAVLERIQFFALGETNTNIRDRFFNSASTTPGIAFGRLINLAQKHLSKLRSDKPGLSVNLDKELQAILGQIKGQTFPALFRLEEQGTFVLGYYHQKNKKTQE